MRVAEVTYDQAVAYDPAEIPDGCGIAVKLPGAVAIIGRIPADVAPDLVVGELRDDFDQPLRTQHTDAAGRTIDGVSTIRTALATPQDLRNLVESLAAVARSETLHVA